MFNFCIVGGPAEGYINRCLQSLIMQDFTDWKACVVLDPAGDRTIEIANSYTAMDSRIKVYSNSTQMYAIPNIIRSIIEMHPADDDVIVLGPDADDWLASPQTLSIVKKYYDEDPNLLLTYGSWVAYPDPSAPTNCRPYTQEDFNRGVRRVDWRATHLRTFKHKVWRHVQDEDLRNSEGQYYRSAWDLAVMLPMVEMAGFDRTRFLAEKLYVYNMETPHNDSKLRLQEQMRFADEIAAKKPYSFMERL